MAVGEEAGPIVDIRLAAGDATLIARITQLSRAQLDIRVDQQLFALVKAVSFDHRSTGYA